MMNLVAIGANGNEYHVTRSCHREWLWVQPTVDVHPFRTSSALSYRNYQYVIMMS